MLKQDEIALLQRCKDDPDPETKPDYCEKHQLHFTSELTKVYSGSKWTKCEKCCDEARRKTHAAMSKQKQPTDKSIAYHRGTRVYSSFRKTVRKKATT